MAHIVIVATGGIRAPSALELLDRFLRDGHQVRLLATGNALRFLWAYLIWRPSEIGKFLRHFRPQFRERVAYLAHRRIGVPHIAEGKWADVAIMVPATSNSIGKLVAGLGDNYPLLVIRAIPRTKRVIIVPSMNPEMWFDPHFQRNVDLLNATEKYLVLCPTRGQMASGDFGIGAQVPLEDIIATTYGELGILEESALIALQQAPVTVPWSDVSTMQRPGESNAIVLVDEDRTLRNEIARALDHANRQCTVLQFDRPFQAMEWLKSHRAALLLSELNFSDGTICDELIDFNRRPGVSWDCQIVVTSTKDRREVGAERLARQDVMFLPKPLNIPFTVGMLSGLIGGARRAPATTIRTLEQGEVLFSEGDTGTDIYILETGTLKVIRQAAGREKFLSIIHPGEIIGEMAFLTRMKRSATIIANEPALLVRIEVEQFYDYLDRQPIWLRKMIDTIVGRLREMSKMPEDANPPQ